MKFSVRASWIRKVHPGIVSLTPEPHDYEQREQNVAMSRLSTTGLTCRHCHDIVHRLLYSWTLISACFIVPSAADQHQVS
jgi:hypothetical protein